MGRWEARGSGLARGHEGVMSVCCRGPEAIARRRRGNLSRSAGGAVPGAIEDQFYDADREVGVVDLDVVIATGRKDVRGERFEVDEQGLDPRPVRAFASAEAVVACASAERRLRSSAGRLVPRKVGIRRDGDGVVPWSSANSWRRVRTSHLTRGVEAASRIG